MVSDKFKHSDDGFKYFIGYKEGEIAKPLCIILPQMTGYIKYFENGGKSLMIMKKETITQVLVMVLKSFTKFFNGSAMISKI